MCLFAKSLESGEVMPRKSQSDKICFLLEKTRAQQKASFRVFDPRRHQKD